MAKKAAKQVPKPKPTLKPKLIHFPDDWISKIDQARGSTSFSDFVREAVLGKIGPHGLSEMPGWGKGRLKDSK